MTYDEAKEILKDYLDNEGNLKLGANHNYVYWERGSEISLGGEFTAAELEAFAAYMKGTPRGK